MAWLGYGAKKYGCCRSCSSSYAVLFAGLLSRIHSFAIFHPPPDPDSHLFRPCPKFPAVSPKPPNPVPLGILLKRRKAPAAVFTKPLPTGPA